MNSILEQLLVTQDRDIRLLRLKQELEHIPIEKGDIDKQRKAATAAADQAKADLKRLEADRKKLEMDVAAKEELARKYKGQLIEIKNNDQFHALQHEIAATEEEIRKLEDQELGIMEKIEQAQAWVRECEAKLKTILASLQLQEDALNKKTEAIVKQAEELKVERAKLVTDFEESVLSRYERIFQSRHGQAIVPISHGMCMGCHLQLTPQTIHSARHDSELVSCTNCGRILYWVAE